VLGTPAYMAPEQVVGEQADHRADIYALGVVAYEMLTGAAPFAGRSAQGMLAAHVLEAPAPITATRVDLPPALVALVMQCLAKERGDRPDSANVVLRALETTSTPSAFVPIGTSQDDQPSIAVLPFENLSPDPADAFFADGLTDEIITDLAAIQALRVIGRSSVSRYRDGGRDPRSVARELGVRHVLEGSVRRAGSSFRLTLRLVDGLTGTTLWSDKLGGQVEDIFAVQETSSRTIVEALRVKLTPQDARRLVDASPRPTFSAEAIDQYLKGRHFFALATADGLANALQCFQRATDLEPDFPAALAGLAATCTFMTLAWQSLPPRETMPRSRAAAQRAIDLDSRLAEAHVALGLVSAFHDWDPRRAESSFRSAIALNANYAEAEYSLVQTLIWLETRFDEGVEHAQRAVAISPLDPWALWYLGLAQYFGRDYEARIETHQRLIALHPHWALGHFGMGATLSTLGRPAEATACHLRAIELDGRWPPHVAWLGVSFALSGRDAEALDCLAELEEQEHRGQSVWAWKLILHAAFGNADEVVRALEQAYEERSSSLIIHLNHPFVDCARENPRFHSLLRRMRLDHLVAYRPRREWRGRDLR
jgi:TolB-like protein/tetratricopeptide (TPR) repeat protein